MTTPGVYSNPDLEAADLKEDDKEAFEQGHDADLTDKEKDIDANISKKSSAIERDPNEVGWDGDTDPENPLNWPASRKWLVVLILSLLTLIT
jgi:hypothetical protein